MPVIVRHGYAGFYGRLDKCTRLKLRAARVRSWRHRMRLLAKARIVCQAVAALPDFQADAMMGSLDSELSAQGVPDFDPTAMSNGQYPPMGGEVGYAPMTPDYSMTADTGPSMGMIAVGGAIVLTLLGVLAYALSGSSSSGSASKAA
jgi:hypothetical protein